jgi:hypothetical protein
MGIIGCIKEKFLIYFPELKNFLPPISIRPCDIYNGLLISFKLFTEAQLFATLFFLSIIREVSSFSKFKFRRGILPDKDPG